MLLRVALGAVYVAMAVGQLASWSAMPAIFGAYRVLPDAAVPVLAAGLIVAELLCGTWFLVRPRSRSATPVWTYTAVTVVWTALGSQAYLRGLPVDNCGCFGLYLAQRLSAFVLAQDALLLVYAVVLLRGARRRRPTVSTPVEGVR